MLLTESLGIAAQEPTQRTKSEGKDTVQKMTSVNPPRSRLLVLPDGTRLLDGDKRYQGPSRRESGQHRHKDKTTAVLSRVLCFTRQGLHTLPRLHSHPLS